MAKVLLIMPRLPQRMGAPYLGQLYVAASLRRAGHEVRALDLAAPHGPGADAAVELCERWAPDLVGMTLFTYSARRGYDLAKRLRPSARMLVAGGPHPTVCPDEPLAWGFDVSLPGEGEYALVALADHLDGRGALADVPNARFEGGRGPTTAPIADLDALPWPHEAYDAFDMRWYQPDGVSIAPGGLMTSRGCPARCTFCANYVTGRAYRWRSAEDVVAEMVDVRQRHDLYTFPIWDDAFTARRPRLYALCDAIRENSDLDGITWTCITPGNMVKPADLDKMREAGCVAINFGIESGDPRILKIIQKGQRPEHVKAAVRAAKAAGMTTIVNFMFGFPEEGVDSLGYTLDLMAELSSETDYFNTRGVLVPFPGTAVYDTSAASYDLEGWWLDLAKVPMEPDFADPATQLTHAEHDPTLDLDFFRYDDAVRDAIAAGVRFKARHNAATLARLTGRASRRVAI